MLNRLIGLLQGGNDRQQAQKFDRLQLATCALLLEVAHSDGRYQAIEARLVNDLLTKKFQMSSAEVAELIDHAEHLRANTHDLFQFAREINAHFTREEKLEVMEGIWRVIYADGTLDMYEDALARQLATLLRLDHKDVIDRKLKVLDEIDPTRKS